MERTYIFIKSRQIPAQECVSLFLAEFVAVLCGSMMLANIPQKKKHPSWSNDPAEKSPWTPSALSRSYGHRRGWRLQVCIPFPWRLESTLVYLGRWWTVMDPYRATWGWDAPNVLQMSSAMHSASVQATSRWRSLGPRSFRPCFLSKVELEPVREMRASVDGFLLLAPCNSMGRLVQERLASLKFLESRKINKGVHFFYFIFQSCDICVLFDALFVISTACFRCFYNYGRIWCHRWFGTPVHT